VARQTAPRRDTRRALQTQVEAFDQIYNTERPHQGLPGRITPQQAWHATPKVEPPRPQPTTSGLVVPGGSAAPAPRPTWLETPGEHLLKIRSSGDVVVHKVAYRIGNHYIGQHVHVIHDTEKISFYDTTTGELLIEHPLPPPGTRSVGNGRPRGGRRKPRTSPMS
jgi:putative transposase